MRCLAKKRTSLNFWHSLCSWQKGTKYHCSVSNRNLNLNDTVRLTAAWFNGRHILCWIEVISTSRDKRPSLWEFLSKGLTSTLTSNQLYDHRNKQSWEIEQTKHSLWVKPPIKLCWDYWSKRPKSQHTHSFHLSSWSWEFQSNWETGWVVTLCWGSWPFDTAKSVLSKLVFGISLAFDSAGMSVELLIVNEEQ